MFLVAQHTVMETALFIKHTVVSTFLEVIFLPCTSSPYQSVFWPAVDMFQFKPSLVAHRVLRPVTELAILAATVISNSLSPTLIHTMVGLVAEGSSLTIHHQYLL